MGCRPSAAGNILFARALYVKLIRLTNRNLQCTIRSPRKEVTGGVRPKRRRPRYAVALPAPVKSRGGFFFSSPALPYCSSGLGSTPAGGRAKREDFSLHRLRFRLRFRSWTRSPSPLPRRRLSISTTLSQIKRTCTGSTISDASSTARRRQPSRSECTSHPCSPRRPLFGKQLNARDGTGAGTGLVSRNEFPPGVRHGSLVLRKGGTHTQTPWTLHRHSRPLMRLFPSTLRHRYTSGHPQKFCVFFSTSTAPLQHRLRCPNGPKKAPRRGFKWGSPCVFTPPRACNSCLKICTPS